MGHDPIEPPRPVFETGRAFALWALNAPDVVVQMELKVRILQALAPLEAKQAPALPKAPPGIEAAETNALTRYSPRRVRRFGVFDGDLQ